MHLEPLHDLGACRTWGFRAKIVPSEDSYPPICRPIAQPMGQKAGGKWTAADNLQPMLPKSDRLLGRGLVCCTQPSSFGFSFDLCRVRAGTRPLGELLLLSLGCCAEGFFRACAPCFSRGVAVEDLGARPCFV